jgi:hypothetical protein
MLAVDLEEQQVVDRAARFVAVRSRVLVAEAFVQAASGGWFRRWERTTFVGGFRQHLAITRVGDVDEK